MSRRRRTGRFAPAIAALLAGLAVAACGEKPAAKSPAPASPTAKLAQELLPAGCAARPCVLLLDDDRGYTENAEWGAMLTSVGIAYTTQTVTWGTACSTDNAPGPLPSLIGWDLVFWETGSPAWTNVSAANQTDAINYLTAAPGGRLVLAGMHVFYSEPSALTLFGTYIGATANTMPVTPWTMVGNGDELCGSSTFTVNTSATASCYNNMGSAWTVQNGAIGCGGYSGKFGIARKEVLSGVPYRTAMYGFTPGQLTVAQRTDLATRLKNWMFRPYSVDTGGPYACIAGVACGLSASGLDVTALPLTFAWDIDNDGVFGESGEPVGQAPNHTFPSTGTFTIGLRVSNAYSSATVTTTVSVTNAAAGQLAFTTAPQTLTAGNCSGVVTVQAQDAAGNPANVSSATTVSLTSTSTGGTFYSDSSCLTGVSSVIIAAGTSSKNFYFKDTRAGSPTITGAGGGLTSATQVETIAAGAPSRLAFLTSPQTLVAGTCSLIATVQSQDGQGNAANVGVATAVGLSTTSTGGTFYSNSSCTTVVTGTTIAAGFNTASFYFKDTRAGTPTLTAAVSGWTSGLQSQTINAGAASRVGFSSAPQTLIAGNCSGVATVQSQDSFGNAKAVSAPTAVGLSSSSTGNTFYSNSACTTVVTSVTISSGASAANLYFKDTRSGTPTLTASVSGWTNGTQVETINAGNAGKLAFLTGTQTLAAGACSGVATIQSQDGYSNPAMVTAATVVGLGSTSANNTFYSNSSCTTVITTTTIAAGTNITSFYFKDTRTGTPTLTASYSTWTSGTQPETINPAAPSKLVFLTASQTLVAGACSAVATLQSQDSYSNVSSVTSATSVTLSSTSTGGTFYSNSSCTTAIASVTLAVGTSSAGFYFKDTRTGTPTVTAAVSGWTSGTQPETINAAAAVRLAFTSPAKTLTAGACSTQVLLQAQDTFGNAANLGAPAVISLVSGSGGSNVFYSDSGCNTVIASVTIASGTANAGYYFKDTATGSPIHTVSGGGLTPGTQTQTVTAGLPSKLSFLTAAQTISAESCSGITTIQTRDFYNNPSNVGATTTVGLASTSGGGTFYSDAACTTAVSSVTIPLGGNSRSFYFKDTNAGSPTLTVSAAPLTNGTQVETITPASATRLVFITTAQTLGAGSCSAITTIQSQTGGGAPANVASATPVALTTTSGGGAFYSNSACTTLITSSTIPAGTATTSFYWKDTAAGSPTLTGTATGFTSGNQGETVTPSAPTKLAFSSTAQVLVAGNCSAATSVQSRDAFDNVSAVLAATTVNLSSSSVGGAFYSNPTCTTAVTSVLIAAGSSSATFYWKDSRSGAPNLTSAATGLTSAVQAQTVNAGAPAKLVFTSPAATLLAGACSPVATLQAQDTLNNPSVVAGATAVSLSSSSTGETFYSDSSCTTVVASVTIAAGAATASFYWKDIRAGTPTLTASATGLSSATQVQTVNAQGAVKLAFTTGAQTVVAGACSAAATTQSQDTYGNAAPVTVTTTLGYSASPASVTFYSNSACTTVITTQTMAIGTSSRTFYFRSNTTGARVVTVTGTSLTSATQTETINAAAAARLAFITPARSVAAGECSLVLSVQARDSFDNPSNVPAATALNLADSSGFGTFYSDSSCNNAVAGVTISAGANTASFYWTDTRVGTPTLTASATGLSNAVQVEAVTASPAATLAFLTSPQTITAGTCAALTTAQSRDSYGNVANVTAPTLVNLGSSSTGGAFYSNSSCTSAISQVTIATGGNSAGFYWMDTVAGTPTLTLSASGLSSATQGQTIGGGAAAKLAFVTVPRVITAGSCSAVVTAQPLDGWDNPTTVGAATQVNLSTSSTGNTFYSDASCTVAVTSVTIAAGGASASFYFRDTVAGSPTLTVAASGLTSATQVETVNASSSTRLGFGNAPVTVAAGACSGELIAQRQDSYGNPTNSGGQVNVALSSDSGAAVFYSDAACNSSVSTVKIKAGTSGIAFYFKDTTAGTPTLTLTANGLTSGAQVETVTAAAASAIVYTSGAQSVNAGACSGAATLESRDLFGNPANVTAPTTVNLTSSSPTGVFFRDACATGASSVLIAAGTHTATFYFRDATTGTPTLTATASGLGLVNQVQTITPSAATTLVFSTGAQTIVAGSCSAITSVQSQDDFNNPTPVAAATSVALTSSSTGGRFYSNSGCTTEVANVTIGAGATTASFYWKDTRSGAPNLTGAATGFSPAVQGQLVNPGPAAKLAFSSAPITVVAGSCSGALTVQAQDTLGNAANVAGPTTVGLVSTAGSTVFYLNSSCGTAGASIVIAAGTSSRTIWFKDNVAGTPAFTASGGGLTPGTQGQTVQAGPLAKVSFTTPAQTLSAGACSAITSLQTRDALNNPANVGPATSAGLGSSSAGGTFFSDPACTAPIAQVTVPAGGNAASFYFKDTVAGTPTLTATISGLTPGTQLETINPAAGSKLVFLTAAQTRTAGLCSLIATVQSQDNSGNPSNVGAATTVALTSTSAGGTFYSNSGCTTPITGTPIAAGTSTASFYWKDTAAGTPTLTAAATGFTSGAQTQTVNAAVPAKLVFTTPAQTVIAGACAPAASIQSQDGFGNPSNVVAATAVTLTSSSPGGTFYSNASCTLPIAGVTILAGTRTAAFYWKDTRSGGPTLTAAATGLTSATQAQTVNPAAPSKLVMTSAAQTVTAGGCSAAVTVQSQDSFGNPSAVGGATGVNLASNSPGGTFYSGAGCSGAVSSVTLAPGNSSVVFYFKDTRAGTPTLTASATGFTPGTQQQTVNAAAAAVLVYTSAPQSLNAGACSAATGLRTQDAYGNLANVGAAVALTLDSTSAGGSFYSDSTCATAVQGVTVAAGASTATFWFKDASAGSPTLTASATGFTSASQVETISAAAPTQLAFVTPPSTIVAGGCSSVVTVQTQDTFGNPSPVTGATTVTLFTNSVAGGFFLTGTCGSATASVTVAAGASSANFYYGDTSAGTPTLTASAAGFTSGNQVVSVNAGTPTKLVFASAAQTLSAGACSAAALVEAQDTFNNPSNVVAATVVAVSSTSPAGTFSAAAGCATPVGSVTLTAGSSSVALYWKDTRTGTPTLTASAAGLASATQAQAVNPAAISKLAVVSPAQTITAGDCSAAASVQTQDSYGNPSNVGAALSVGLGSSSTGGTFYSNSTCSTLVSAVTVAAGANTAAFYFKDTRSGTPTLTVSGGGYTPAAQLETILAASPARLAFTTGPKTLAAGVCSSAATIQIQDSYGNPTSVAAATGVGLDTTSSGGSFYSDAACTVPVAAINVAAGGNSASFYFADTRAGTPLLTVSAAGLSSAAQAQTINPASATRLAFVSAAQSLTAGACSALATVQAQDPFGNPAPGPARTVALTTSSSGGAFFSDPACNSSVASTAILAGSSNAVFYFRDSRAGSPSLTATTSGLTPASQVQTIGPAAASKLAFISAAQTLTAGACSAAAVVEQRDTFDNPVPASAATSVGLSSTSTGASFYSDPACASPAASVTIAAGATRATFYFADTRAGAPVLTAGAAALGSTTQAQTINPASASLLAFGSGPQALVAGSCSALTSLQTQDTFGNVSSVAAATSVSLSTSSGAGAFYLDSSCTTLAGSVTVAAGTSTAGFYFKDTRAGTPTLTASAATLTSASQAQTINPAAATRLAFVSLAQSVTAGTCSAVAVVQSQDTYANVSAVGALTTLNLASGSGTLRFYSDASCATQVTTRVISAGGSSAGFFFKDTAAGTPTITVSATSFSSASQVEAVNPAPAARLVFVSGAQTVTAGLCSLVTTVQSQDNLGNASNVAVPTSVSLSTNSTAGTFYSDSGCATGITAVTIGAGTNSAGFYFKDTRAGAPVLSAGASGFASGTQTQTINPANPAKLVFTTSAQSVTAGVCSGIATVQARDSFDNPSSVTAPTTLFLGSTSGGGSFSAAAGCATTTSSVTMGAGTNTASFYFRDSEVGAPTLTVSGGGLAPATQVETISAAVPTKLVFITAPQSRAAGACSALTTVQSQDSFDNPANVAPSKSVALSSSSPGGTFYSNSACTVPVASVTISAGQNTAGFYWKDTVAGTPTLTAAASGLTNGTQGETILPAAPAKLVITSAVQNLQAGACSASMTVQAQDTFGNASSVSGATTINLASSSSGGSFAAVAGCAPGAGSVTMNGGTSSTTFFYQDTWVGSPTVTASATGLTSATQVESIAPATASRLVFTSTAQSLTAGICSALAAFRTEDAFNNVSPVTGATVVGLASNSTGGTFYSDSTCTVAVTTATVAAGASTGSFYFKDTRAGTPTLTLSHASFTSGTQGETILAAAAAKLAFTNTALTITAGACSPALTIRSQDTFGNTANVVAATTVALSTGSPAGAFYSNSGCTTAVSSRSIAAGASSATVYYRDTQSGSPLVTAAASGLASGTQTETVNAAAASKLVVTTPSRTVNAGVCSAQVTVQSQDTYGNPSSVAPANTLTLTSNSGSLSFSAAAGCATAVTTVNIAAGTSTASFYFKDSASGARTVTATSATLGAIAQAQTVSPAPPSKIVFSTSAQTLIAGACSAVVGVQTQDAFGNASGVTTATTLALASNSAGGGFYSDSTCLSAISTLSLAIGQSSRTFYYRDTRAAPATLTVSGGTLTSGTQNEAINAAAPTVLAFTTAPQSIPVGTCSAIATLRSQDAFGNVSNVGASTLVNLASSSPGGTFYSNPTCTSAVSGASIAAAGNTASFYFKDTRSGPATITGSAAGFESATQVATFSAGAANRLAFTSAAQTVTAGVCSGATVFQVQDSLGNATTVTAATSVALASSSPGASFFSDSACTAPVFAVALAAGGSGGTFYWKDTRIGTPTLTLSAGVLTPGTQAEAVEAAAPAKIAYLTAPQTLVAGACSAVLSVQTQDAFGNVSNVGSSILVTLASSSTAGSFFADPSCNSEIAAVTVVIGTNGASLYYQDTRAGTATATASSAGLVSGTQVETITPDIPAKLVFVTAPQAIGAGNCSAATTVQTQDAYGNGSPLGPALTVALGTTSAAGSFFSVAGCGGTAVSSVPMPAGTSSATFFFDDGQAGSPTLSATVPGLATANQVQSITPAAAVAMAFTTPPQTINAGACSAVITLQTRDALGNLAPVAAASAVTLAVAPGTGTFYSNPGCTAVLAVPSIAAGGTGLSFYFKDTALGVRTLSATASGLGQVTQPVDIVTAGSATRLAFTTSSQVLGAGACSAAVTVQSQDSFGNPVTRSADTAVALATDSAGGLFYSDPGCSLLISQTIIAAAADATTFYFRDTRAGTPTLTTATAGLTNATQGQTVLAGAPALLAFTTPARTLVAGSCSPAMIVQSQDQFGNAANLAAASLVGLASGSPGGGFFSDAACATAATSAPIDSGANAATFYYRDVRAGSSVLTASLAGLSPGSQTETITPAGRVRLAFATAAQTVNAGACSSRASVRFEDSFGNPATVSAATVVSLVADAATTFFYSDPLCATAVTGRTAGSGQSAITFYFKDNLVGSPALTASTAGLIDATQTQTIIPVAASRLAIATPARSVIAGQCSLIVTVESRDVLGNASPVSANTSVVLASTSPRATFYSDPACSNAVPTVVIAAGGAQASFYFRDLEAGAPAVSASNPGLLTATQDETVSPAAVAKLSIVSAPQTLVTATCSAVVTLESHDDFGNPSAVAGATTAALTSNSATGTFYSDPTCLTAISTVTIPATDIQAAFYFMDTRAGSATLTATAAGLAPAAQVETFLAGIAARLGFTTPPRSVLAGTCSAAVGLESQDASGNTTAVASDQTVSLSSSVSTTRFYADAQCITLATSVTILSGRSAAGFFFKDTAAGAPQLRGTGATVGTATQTQTVTGAAAVALFFGTPPRTFRVGSCSPAIQVELHDPYDNPTLATSAVALALASSSPTGAFFSDPACGTPLAAPAIDAGQSGLSVYYLESKVGSPTLTASAAGLTDATQVETVTGGTPAMLAFVTAAQTVPVGVCSRAATVEVRDAQDNASPVDAELQVTLLSTSAGGSFYSDATCSTAVAAINVPLNATSADFFFKDSVAGAPTLSALGAGLSAATQTETIIIAGQAVQLGFGNAARTVEAGACSEYIEVQAQDLAGNASPLTASVEVRFTLTSALGAQTAGLYADAACSTGITTATIEPGAYRVLAYLKDPVVEAVTVSAEAAGLTSVTQDEAVVCPKTSDGAFCDDGDLCNGRETCQGGLCAAGVALECNDQDACTADGCQPALGCANTVIPSCCRQPLITREANPDAAVGVPYRYSAAGLPALAKGTGPFGFFACGLPPADFRVDTTTGAIDWTPTQAGPVSLCIEARGACGTDSYPFTVDVAAGTPTLPLAAIRMPSTTVVGTKVFASAEGSTPSPAYTYEWSFGDGTPMQLGDPVEHTYAQAGGYVVRLTLFDSVGQSSTATASIRVTSAQCPKVPTVRIEADRLTGADALEVAFKALFEGADPSPILRWDFGDGTSAVGATASHAFGPGNFEVRLTAVGADGCTASDAVTVAVLAGDNRAPHCELTASPIFGPAPLTTEFSARFGDADGKVASATWLFSDGVSADATRFDGIATRQLDRAGVLGAVLEVVDDQGARCRASVSVEASNAEGVTAPEIVSVPTLTASCQVPYVYGEDGIARATGGRPLTWSLGRNAEGAPSGMSIDEAGAILWTPDGKKKAERVTLVAQNAAGSIEQDFLVKVECKTGVLPGCGCSSVDAPLLTLIGLAALSLLRRRKSR